MANKIGATVLIALPENRQQPDGEHFTTILCQCGAVGVAVKMTAGKVDRLFCQGCLGRFVAHYMKIDNNFHLYGVNK